MPFNSDKLICSWCLEEKVSSVISFCTNCGDSSYVCHSCLREGKSKVFNQQLITDCSICKENKLINLPNKPGFFAFGIQKLFSVNSIAKKISELETNLNLFSISNLEGQDISKEL